MIYVLSLTTIILFWMVIELGSKLYKQSLAIESMQDVIRLHSAEINAQGEIDKFLERQQASDRHVFECAMGRTAINTEFATKLNEQAKRVAAALSDVKLIKTEILVHNENQENEDSNG